MNPGDKGKISDAATTDERVVRRSVILAASMLPGPLRPADPTLWPGEIKQPRRQGNQQFPTLRVVGTLRKRKTFRCALPVKFKLAHRIPLAEQQKAASRLLRSDLDNATLSVEA
jgi:hypothetical protein